MKRTFSIAGIVLVVLASGAGAAFAGTSSTTTPSYQCRDGANATQATVPGYAFGVETGPSGPGETGATLCYSDTQNGTPSQVTGGYVHARQDQDGDTSLGCKGDRPAAAVTDCSVSGNVRTTDDTNPSTVGRTVTAQLVVTGTPVGQTGAQANPTASFDASGPTTDGMLGSGTGTCYYVNGSTNCPPNATIADWHVSNGDITPSTTTGWYGCFGLGGCHTAAPGVTVTVGGDTSTSTVSGTVNGVAATRDVAKQCISVGISCPP